jgi:cellulose synthase/poly-beta-1,6-N-acetylglucosamine synthase-like glycosyltransferase
VELLAIPVRGGKENAQKEAIKKAKGEILVFTDVATILDPSGVEQIVSNFADPSVGCVSSEDQVIGKDGKPTGEGFYVRYEMWLRRFESRVNSLVGLSGSFFAARKSVCQDFSEDLDSDFRVLLTCVKKGLRGVSDPLAIGYYRDISDQKREFERKVRTVLRGLTVFFKNTELLNGFKYGIFSYQYFCHKLLRWLVPLFLITAFVSLGLLASTSWAYFAIFITQIFFIIIFVMERYGITSFIPKIFNVPIYFISVNVSILIAWYRYLRHERVVIWNPTIR